MHGPVVGADHALLLLILEALSGKELGVARLDAVGAGPASGRLAQQGGGCAAGVGLGGGARPSSPGTQCLRLVSNNEEQIGRAHV